MLIKKTYFYLAKKYLPVHELKQDKWFFMLKIKDGDSGFDKPKMKATARRMMSGRTKNI